MCMIEKKAAKNERKFGKLVKNEERMVLSDFLSQVRKTHTPRPRLSRKVPKHMTPLKRYRRRSSEFRKYSKHGPTVMKLIFLNSS